MFLSYCRFGSERNLFYILEVALVYIFVVLLLLPFGIEAARIV